MTQFSHFPYPNQYLILPETVQAIQQDTYIYIGPAGSDTLGDGTETNPYATLTKAWQVAQNMVIMGNATVYITFLKGFYNITNPDTFFPANLYHPQGSNIIVQGDPRALRQNYLYNVKQYNWDFGVYGHSGHTGTVNLWTRGSTGEYANSGFTGPGTTAHGYTSEDVGLYVAITTPWLSSPVYYYDYQNRVYGNRYGSYWIPRHSAASHQESTEQAYASLWFGHSPRNTSITNHGGQFGIVGVAKIIGATASIYDLQLGFKNANLDARNGSLLGGARGVSIDNGSGVSVPLYGVAGNMPNNQAYYPVGYYGGTYGWGRTSGDINAGRNGWDDMRYTAGATPGTYNGDTDASVYPPIPASTPHVSDEALLVTNYPVVLHLDGTDDYRMSTPIVMKGAKLKALRNLFFSQAQYDPVGVPASERRASYSLAATCNLPTLYSFRACMTLFDSEVAIRHIGIQGLNNPGYGACIQLVRSKMTTYDEYDGVDYSIGSGEKPSNYGEHPYVYARLGSGSNTPVLMINNPSGSGIYSENSVLNLTAGAYPSDADASDRSTIWTHRTRLTQEPVWIQTGSSGYYGSKKSYANFGHAIFNNTAQFPAYRLRWFLPYWVGMNDVNGTSGGIYSAGMTGSLGQYRFAENPIMYLKTPTAPGEGITLGRVHYKYRLNSTSEYSTQSSTFTAPNSFWLNTGSGYGTNAGPSADAGEGWRFFEMDITAVGACGPNGTSTTDFAAGTIALGNTLSFVSYADDALTVKNPSRFEVGKDLIRIQVRAGVTYEVRSSGVGAAALYEFNPHGGYSQPCKSPRFAQTQSCIALSDSEMTFSRSLVLSGGAYGIAATVNSKITHPCMAPNSQYPACYVMCERQTVGAILASDTSYIKLPTIYSKNPPFVPHLNSSVGGTSVYSAIRADLNSRVEIGGESILVTSTKTPFGAWGHFSSSTDPARWGSNATATTWAFNRHLYATQNSQISTTGTSTYRHLLLTDGAVYQNVTEAPSESKDARASHICAEQQSRIGFVSNVPPTSAATNGVSNYTNFRIYGWSGANAIYNVQASQTDATKRFQENITPTNSPMWRFWNHPYGVTSSNSTPNTVFYSLPIMVNSANTAYGQSAVVAVDGVRDAANLYGANVVAPVFGTVGSAGSAGVSYAFVNLSESALLTTRF